MRRMYVASFVWTSTEDEWNAQDVTSWTFITGSLITSVLVITNVSVDASSILMRTWSL